MPKSAWREGGPSIIVIAASTLPPPPLPPTPALCHLPQDKGSARVASQVLSALAYLAPDLVLVSPACLLSICFRCLPARRPACYLPAALGAFVEAACMPKPRVYPSSNCSVPASARPCLPCWRLLQPSVHKHFTTALETVTAASQLGTAIQVGAGGCWRVGWRTGVWLTVRRWVLVGVRAFAAPAGLLIHSLLCGCVCPPLQTLSLCVRPLLVAGLPVPLEGPEEAALAAAAAPAVMATEEQRAAAAQAVASGGCWGCWPA